MRPTDLPQLVKYINSAQVSTFIGKKNVVAWSLFVVGLSYAANGQELEPGAYAALPKNLNTIAVAYGFSRGNVLTDPSLLISDSKISFQSLTGAYLGTLAVANKLAPVQVNIPFIQMFGKLQLNGHDTSGSRNGFGDARIRLGINLSGTGIYSNRCDYNAVSLVCKHVF